MSKIQDILNEMVNILINQRGKTFNFDVSFFQFTYTEILSLKPILEK